MTVGHQITVEVLLYPRVQLGDRQHAVAGVVRRYFSRRHGKHVVLLKQRAHRRADTQWQTPGSGTVVWQLSEEVKAGKISIHDFMAAEAGMSRSADTRNTMGTASTMACMAEALGTSLPHNAAIPAVDSRRYVLAHLSGMRIAEMVREDLRLSKILTREAFENAIQINAAIGGSTNVVTHLKAIAGRMGVELELDVDETCVLVVKNCRPKGYLGTAEVSNTGLPPKVLAKGITDMVRNSDARMSGTAYGTVVLHVTPETAASGPVAVVRNGDFIEPDCADGRLHLDISEAELQTRLAAWQQPQSLL